MLVQKFSQESSKVVISADNRRGDVFSTTLDATQEEFSDIEDMSSQCTINKVR